MNKPPRALRSEATAKVWQAEIAKTRTLVDRLGKGLDSGIEDTVTALRLMGFATNGSCEGHLDWGTATPWVSVTSPVVDQILEEINQTPPYHPRLRELGHAARTELWKPHAAVNALLEEFNGQRNTRPALRLTTVPVFTDLVHPHEDNVPAEFRIGSAAEHVFDDFGKIARATVTGAGRREMKAFTSFLIDQHLAPALEATAAISFPQAGPRLSGPTLS